MLLHRLRRQKTQHHQNAEQISRIHVATGDEGSFFINNNGKLALWRDNTAVTGKVEECPLNDTTQEALKDVTFVSVQACTNQASQFVTLVSDRGKVYTWGSGAWGRLGHGNVQSNEIPMKIMALTQYRVVSLAADNHCLAVTDSGILFSWGLNEYGQCGHPPADANIMEPRRILSPSVSRWKHISVGGAHSLIVSGHGDLYTFGSNFNGMLGNGSCDDCAHPTAVRLPGTCIATAAGANHSLAVTEDGNVYAWGLDLGGELGVVVQSRSVIIYPIAGRAHRSRRSHSQVASSTPMLFADSQITSSSHNVVTGQITQVHHEYFDAINHSESAQQPRELPAVFPIQTVPQMVNRTYILTPNFNIITEPRRVPHLHNAIKVSAFESTSCAITHDGKLFTWGTRSNNTQNIPTKVEVDRAVVAASISTLNNIAVTVDGEVFYWTEAEPSMKRHIYTFTKRTHISN